MMFLLPSLLFFLLETSSFGGTNSHRGETSFRIEYLVKLPDCVAKKIHLFSLFCNLISMKDIIVKL